MRTVLCCFCLLALAACQAGSGETGARAFVEGLPDRLLAEGPRAWEEVFTDESKFFMASDGVMAFASPDEATAFLEDFAPEVETLDIQWTDLRIEWLGPDLAAMATPYAETITMRDGSVRSFGGFMTGVVQRTGEGWRIQHLHWSSPVEEETP